MLAGKDRAVLFEKKKIVSSLNPNLKQIKMFSNLLTNVWDIIVKSF